MKVLRKEKHIFKKGEIYHLDHVYMLMGLFPNPINDDEPYYQQDDIADLGRYGQNSSVNDCGESVKILRNFTIDFSIKG